MMIFSNIHMSRHQAGTTTVEFAIVGAVVFMTMFGVMEAGRLLYSWETLNEVSRQASRLASVCLVKERGAVATDVATRLGGALPGLNSSNLVIEYLGNDSDPDPLPDPEVSDFDKILYVRSSIVNYNYEMILPLTVDLSMLSPDFSTTFRVESLGVTKNGEIPCFP
jgi:hypothetical protein